jgi:peroxiredoxin
MIRAAACVAAIGWCGLGATTDGRGATLQVGDVAPDFTLMEYGTQNEVSLYDFEGRIVLLDFFAYWCPHCVTAASELEPEIATYYQQQGGNPDGIPVQLVALTVDNRDPAAVESFIDQHQLPLALDDGAAEVFFTYSAQGFIPHLALINGASGTNYAQWEVLHNLPGYGEGDYADLRSMIDSIAVPEPAAIWLVAMAVGGLVGGACRTRHRR